jgi:hypothetical protein
MHRKVYIAGCVVVVVGTQYRALELDTWKQYIHGQTTRCARWPGAPRIAETGRAGGAKETSGSSQRQGSPGRRPVVVYGVLALAGPRQPAGGDPLDRARAPDRTRTRWTWRGFSLFNL